MKTMTLWQRLNIALVLMLLLLVGGFCIVYWTVPFKAKNGLSVPTPRQQGNRLFITSFYNGSLMLQFQPVDHAIEVATSLAVDQGPAVFAPADRQGSLSIIVAGATGDPSFT